MAVFNAPLAELKEDDAPLRSLILISRANPAF
jgi:hypothetical protein